MGLLADAVYQRTVQDQKSFERKVKIKNFINISAGTMIVLGIALIPATILKNVNNNYDKQQQYLKSIEENPAVYEEKEIQGCKINYIETSHKNENNQYVQDLYLKSTCGDQVSVTKVKERINTSRMKLAQNQNTDVKKNNM